MTNPVPMRLYRESGAITNFQKYVGGANLVRKKSAGFAG